MAGSKAAGETTYTTTKPAQAPRFFGGPATVTLPAGTTVRVIRDAGYSGLVRVQPIHPEIEDGVEIDFHPADLASGER